MSTPTTDTNDSIFTALTFLTGTSFASLFFLLQSIYSHNLLLLTTLSVACVIFLWATIGRLGIATGKYARATPFANAISWMTIGGVILLVFSILELVFNLNPLSGVITLMAFAGCFVILSKLRKN